MPAPLFRLPDVTNEPCTTAPPIIGASSPAGDSAGESALWPSIIPPTGVHWLTSSDDATPEAVPVAVDDAAEDASVAASAGGADAFSAPPIRIGVAASPPPPTESDAFVLNPVDGSPFLRLPDIPNQPNNAPPNDRTFFSFNDPGHAWMNARPYGVLDFLGRGGFGMVYKVELLTPAGFTLKVDETGLPDLEGKTALKRMTNYVGPIVPLSVAKEYPENYGQKLNRSGLLFALKKMSPESGHCDWDDCLREIKLMQTLEKVWVFLAFIHIIINKDDA